MDAGREFLCPGRPSAVTIGAAGRRRVLERRAANHPRDFERVSIIGVVYINDDLAAVRQPYPASCFPLAALLLPESVNVNGRAVCGDGTFA